MTSSFRPIVAMRERLQIDRNESDTAFFYSLLYFGELLVKLTTVGMLSLLDDDRDRHRYRLSHRLVRADGLGEWVQCLDEMLQGPAAHNVIPMGQPEKHLLTERAGVGSWQYESIQSLTHCLITLGGNPDQLPAKIAARNWFGLFVQLRNRTRGHGATRPSDCSTLCGQLERSTSLIADNLTLFSQPWAYLHRNISGKYRVNILAGDPTPFEPFRRNDTYNYANGVYVFMDGMRSVPLLQSDADSTDFFLPNGLFSDKRFQLLSYITNDVLDGDSSLYMTPTEPLPESTTQGLADLRTHEGWFTNVPPVPDGYVERVTLERDIVLALKHDHRPIITLAGPGGIGKTSAALKAIHDLASASAERFVVALWFSARDIDLLPEGPRVVQAHVVTIDDVAREVAILFAPGNLDNKKSHRREYLSQVLQKGPIGPMLFVFDNFETVSNPSEVFEWLESFVRPPNKILITTRSREFNGDFQIPVPAMAEDEGLVLIANTAEHLGVADLMPASYRHDLYTESDGHPYVMKVLVGEVAKAGRPVKVERIVATKDQILTALFERTYSRLSPAAQRIFLTLCNWRSMIPEVGLQAVVLRPQNERIDIDRALTELFASSLVEEMRPESSKEVFLHVPLAAGVFGRKKLPISPWKTYVEADSAFLIGFGAAQRSDLRHGIGPRIERFVATMVTQIMSGALVPSEAIAMLEFIAHRYPRAWLLLVDLYEETNSDPTFALRKAALSRYLEDAPKDQELSWVWKRLADLCRDSKDPLAEIHALVALCETPELEAYAVGNAINRINSALHHAERRVLDTEEKRILLRRVSRVVEMREGELSATDCSRAAWLYLHMQEEQMARQIAELGLAGEPDNEYCLAILRRLDR